MRRTVKPCKSKERPSESIEIVLACQDRVKEAVLDNHGRVENLRNRLIDDLSVVSQEKGSYEFHFTKSRSCEKVLIRDWSGLFWFSSRQNFSQFEC